MARPSKVPRPAGTPRSRRSAERRRARVRGVAGSASARSRRPLLRWAVRPTLRGAALALAGVALLTVGLLQRSTVLGYAGALLLAAVATAVLLVLLLRPRPTVDRRLDRALVPAGGAVEVRLQLRNPRTLPMPPGDWTDVFDDPFTADAGGRTPRIPGRGEGAAVIAYRIETSERGDYTVGPLRAVVTDPLGLARSERTAEGSASLVVTPRITPLLDVAYAAQLDQGVSARRQLRSDRTVRDVTAREYRPGDPLRHMHWRATAHHGELMVRQEEHQERSRSLLLLDTRAESYLTAAERALAADPRLERNRRELLGLTALSRFEWAVEALASLAAFLDAQGVRVRLLDGGTGDGTGNDGLEAVLLRLARVDLSDDRADAHEALLRSVSAELAEGPQPVFGVTGAHGDEELGALGALRSRAGAGTLLLMDEDEPVAVALRDQGWRVGVMDLRSEVAFAWSDDPTREAPDFFEDLVAAEIRGREGRDG
ncbi:DUF58 domain-containing protein [Arenivirga flava]|uniref:DUF58 domain-containing protein n=1 Tax=Arenivirga flava TaxID=1930060 RepID=A0AA37XCC4_9MICO|nr:DUF58 domain-containing protein [Arenivirga flava]GMA29625.1 hypothetical protein GCM10025874_28780 [Arenivirga flava]